MNELTNFDNPNSHIRKEWHNEEWYFSVVDIIEVLTESATPRKYWNTLKSREPQLSSICGQLKLPSKDGKLYATDCANTEGVLRIVMSVPSPKAEPLKLWLAEQGKRTLDETENPELLTQRQFELYKAKGYPETWIKERMKSIETRNKLTDEWQKRGVQEGKEYSILTAIIAKGSLGVTPSEHKDLKGLTKPSQNLRDHMTDLELIFMSLGEALTRNDAIKNDAQGFYENKDSATIGGDLAATARTALENRTGEKIVTSKNFLSLNEGDTPKELPPQ
jgi:prophage antirepressor-like protein